MKFPAFLLALLFTVCLFSACGQEEEETLPMNGTNQLSDMDEEAETALALLMEAEQVESARINEGAEPSRLFQAYSVLAKRHDAASNFASLSFRATNAGKAYAALWFYRNEQDFYNDLINAPWRIDEAAAYSMLMEADRVESPYAEAAPSKLFRAFAILARSPNAINHFASLLHKAENAGKAYAALWFYWNDQDAYASVKSSWISQEKVNVLLGCEMAEFTMAEFLQQIEEGNMEGWELENQPGMVDMSEEKVKMQLGSVKYSLTMTEFLKALEDENLADSFTWEPTNAPPAEHGE
jgi:hypothetical protein